MEKLLMHKVIFSIVLVTLFLSCLSASANVRIVSYNIKDFWLRFDGEPGSIANEGAKTIS